MNSTENSLYRKIMTDPLFRVYHCWSLGYYWSAGLALLLLLKKDIVIEGDYCWDVIERCDI